MSENKYLRTIVKALDDKKGNDIRVIRISEISSMCDYLVIADGSNRNQVQAMCNNVEHATILLSILPSTPALNKMKDTGTFL